MATTTSPDEAFEEHILDVDVTEEMESSYLEYAYSVIYSRALPDARDGLKPVQRRILFSMDEMGIRPDKGHVKCARVVGQVMGVLHPHGDTAIYDALVRLGQPWAVRLPLVDGHGNFGSLDAGPAAMRYTECRMAPAATAMTRGLAEDTVDFRPNYDGRETEPTVLPAAFPNLIVNGAAGIAVGMATSIAPHNLIEVVAALKQLLANPKIELSELMRYLPGPDFPTGGKIIGLDGVKDAYTVPCKSANEQKALLSRISQETGAVKVPLSWLEGSLAMALADGLAAGLPPAAGLIEVAELCGLDKLRPEAVTTEALIAALPVTDRIRGLSAQARGKLINASEGWWDRHEIVQSWFEESDHAHEVLEGRHSPRALDSALWRWLETRRDFWARLVGRAADVLAAADHPDANSFTATAMALLEGRDLCFHVSALLEPEHRHVQPRQDRDLADGFIVTARSALNDFAACLKRLFDATAQAVYDDAVAQEVQLVAERLARQQFPAAFHPLFSAGLISLPCQQTEQCAHGQEPVFRSQAAAVQIGLKPCKGRAAGPDSQVRQGVAHPDCRQVTVRYLPDQPLDINRVFLDDPDGQSGQQLLQQAGMIGSFGSEEPVHRCETSGTRLEGLAHLLLQAVKQQFADHPVQSVMPGQQLQKAGFGQLRRGMRPGGVRQVTCCGNEQQFLPGVRADASPECLVQGHAA